MSTVATVPESDVDLFSDEHLADPYADYARLRDAGPAVYLSRYDMWAIGRYAPARRALENWRTFTSTQGVSVGKEFIPFFEGSTLYLDPPDHERLRRVLSERLTTKALSGLVKDVEARADELVTELALRGSFDAVKDLAEVFPVTLVADLIGLPQEGRERLLARASAAFNFFGPANQRAADSMPLFQEIAEYIGRYATREQLTPRSFGVTIYEAVDAGQISEREGFGLLLAYLIAGIDTTVNAIGSAVWLLASHPYQWQLLHDDPSLGGTAFEEAIRMETPVTGFVRTVVEPVDVDGVPLGAGDRVLILFGSANRDERHWEAPERFDIRREVGGHLGFGYGLHACAGRGFARLEGRAILAALSRHLDALEVGEPTRLLNNAIHGFASLPLTETPRT
jgi:cytochrome P450